jgi:hypothetical protein
MVVLGYAHLQLARYLQRRLVRNDLDWLSPCTRSIELIRRNAEMQVLRGWLADSRQILVRAP